MKGSKVFVTSNTVYRKVPLSIHYARIPSSLTFTNLEPRERRGNFKSRMLEPKFREQLSQMKLQEMEMRSVMKNLIIYFFYVAIIFIVSYGNRDPSAFMV